MATHRRIPTMRGQVIAIGLALVALLGCDTPKKTVTDSKVVSHAVSTGVRPIVIRTTDGGVKLGFAHDTVFMGLSDSVVNSARTDMAREAREARDSEDQSAFGRSIAGFVKKTVGKALGTRMIYPLQDIDSVRYDNGTIVFTYVHPRTVRFERFSSGRRSVLSSFPPAEAQHFVTVVDSALRIEHEHAAAK